MNFYVGIGINYTLFYSYDLSDDLAGSDRWERNKGNEKKCSNTFSSYGRWLSRGHMRSSESWCQSCAGGRG